MRWFLRVIRMRELEGALRAPYGASGGNFRRGEIPARSRVHGGPIARMGRARGVELGSGAEARVGEAGCSKALHRVAIQFFSIVLKDGLAFPIEPQPVQIVEQ